MKNVDEIDTWIPDKLSHFDIWLAVSCPTRSEPIGIDSIKVMFTCKNADQLKTVPNHKQGRNKSSQRVIIQS